MLAQAVFLKCGLKFWICFCTKRVPYLKFFCPFECCASVCTNTCVGELSGCARWVGCCVSTLGCCRCTFVLVIQLTCVCSVSLFVKQGLQVWKGSQMKISTCSVCFLSCRLARHFIQMMTRQVCWQQFVKWSVHNWPITTRCWQRRKR